MKNVFIHSYFGTDEGVDGLYEVSFPDGFDFREIEDLFHNSFEELEEKIENDPNDKREVVGDMGELLDYMKEQNLIEGYTVHQTLMFDCDYGNLSGAYEALLY